ncbi:hypothetical protein DSL72_003418 [Monilinia vaccinii-corymbosi]|uniref:Uncharacterized protein n=1 Tax=Monilinia vaccinii-corymbosi TaxID=61207 RepID=A0A8A3NWT0_9HELO|nr:hypothetical protein DSL72_003418 [Monilinia vaccinii-corymbosi]
MDQIPELSSSSLSAVTPVTSSSTDQPTATPSSTDILDDNPKNGAETKWKGKAPLTKRESDDELHHEEAPRPENKAKSALNGTNHNTKKTAKYAELINAYINESDVIGDCKGKRITRREVAAEQSDANNSKVESGSSKGTLSRLDTSTPAKITKLNNTTSARGKKRKREEAEETRLDIAENQRQLDSSKRVGPLSSAKRHKTDPDALEHTPFPLQSITELELPSIAAAKEKNNNKLTFTYKDPEFFPVRSEATQNTYREGAEIAPHITPSSSRDRAEPQTSPNVAPKSKKKKAKKARKIKVPCGAAQLKWLGVQPEAVQKEMWSAADLRESQFPNDTVVVTEIKNGEEVRVKKVTYYMTQYLKNRSSPPLSVAKQAGRTKSFKYKVHFPSEFLNLMVQNNCIFVPRYVEFTLETTSERGFEKKVEIQRKIREKEAKGEKLMFEMLPEHPDTIGQEEAVEREFAAKFKLGASAEDDVRLKEEIRRRMKEAAKKLRLEGRQGLDNSMGSSQVTEEAAKEVMRGSKTKKERIFELKQMILQQIREEDAGKEKLALHE